jgi:hypothetical protein
MEASAQERVQDANIKLRSILSQARNALTGQQVITPETIRSISQTLTEMAPVVSQAGVLRVTDMALEVALREYSENLEELQTALEQVRFMLLARQAQLEASRCHREAVNRWATAFQQTR